MYTAVEFNINHRTIRMNSHEFTISGRLTTPVSNNLPNFGKFVKRQLNFLKNLM